MKRREFLKSAAALLGAAALPLPKLPPPPVNVDVPLRHAWGRVVVSKESLKVGSRGAWARALAVDLEALKAASVATLNQDSWA
jgi:hypothetical protein